MGTYNHPPESSAPASSQITPSPKQLDFVVTHSGLRITRRHYSTIVLNPPLWARKTLFTTSKKFPPPTSLTHFNSPLVDFRMPARFVETVCEKARSSAVAVPAKPCAVCPQLKSSHNGGSSPRRQPTDNTLQTPCPVPMNLKQLDRSAGPESFSAAINGAEITLRVRSQPSRFPPKETSSRSTNRNLVRATLRPRHQLQLSSQNLPRVPAPPAAVAEDAVE